MKHFQQSTTIFLQNEMRERVVGAADCVFIKSSTRVFDELADFGIRPIERQLVAFGFYGVRKRGSNSFHCIITRRRPGAAY